MTNLRRPYRTSTVTAVMAIGIVVISPAVQNCAAQDAVRGDHWNMIYHAGAAPIRTDSKVDVTLESGKILLRVKKGPEFAIPLQEITAVSSSVKGHYGRVSLAEAKFAGSLMTQPGRCGPGPDYGCAAVILTSLMLIAPSYPIKTTDRVVQIVWRERNLDEEIILKLHKGDFDPFLAQLEKATTKPWKNLDEEWVKVQHELKNAEPSKIAIGLDRRVTIAKVDLEAGIYEIIVLEREANRGELYFFLGSDVNIDRLAAVTEVEIVRPANDESKFQVDYKQDAGGKTKISSIQTPSKIFRFLENLPPIASRSSAP